MTRKLFILTTLIVSILSVNTGCVPGYIYGQSVQASCEGVQGNGDGRRDFFQIPIITEFWVINRTTPRELVIEVMDDEARYSYVVLYLDSDFAGRCNGTVNQANLDTDPAFGRRGELIEVTGVWYNGEIDGAFAGMGTDDMYFSK